MHPFRYVKPEQVDDACLILERDEAGRPLAGGMSLLPMMKLRFAQPAHLIDINRIAELRGVCEDGAEVVIGAMTVVFVRAAGRWCSAAGTTATGFGAGFFGDAFAGAAFFATAFFGVAFFAVGFFAAGFAAAFFGAAGFAAAFFTAAFVAAVFFAVDFAAIVCSSPESK